MRKKGTPLIRAKKTEYKGKNFQSRLEVYMFKLLDDNGVKCKYEEEKFTIIDSFFFPNPSYEKTINSKNNLVNKGNKKHLGIIYTPDFIVENGDQRIIIECKGLATDVFSMRFKLFKKWIADNKLNYVLFTPRNQGQCDFVFEQVKKLLNE
jgi:predicted nuclease of restriction endonuclease-like RecB superfamily